MTPAAQPEQIATRLRERLEELETRLARVTRDLSRAHASDSQEQAQERENDEVLDAIRQETEASIGAVRAALRRLEEGSYGLCRSCGEPVPEARLAALPETTSCLRCEAARESAR